MKTNIVLYESKGVNMTNTTLTLNTKLPGTNQIIETSKKHPKAYAAMKKEYTTLVIRELIQQKCVPSKSYKKICVNYEFYEKRNEARDPDNILGGSIKFIHDAMVAVGIIDDDDIYNISFGNINFIPNCENYKIKISWV